MDKKDANKIARALIKLPVQERSMVMTAFDTDTRILVMECLYHLKGDCPPGKIPNCS